MKIAVIAHIRHAIARPFMGGMESHCHALMEGLLARGHDATLFSAGNSDFANHRSICAQPYEAVLPWDEWRGTDALAQYQEAAFSRAWDDIAKGGFDIIHNNSLFPDLMDWGRRDGVPMVTSQHVPPYALMRAAVDRIRDVPGQEITVTSAAQLVAWQGTSTGNMHIVHNGVDLIHWQPKSPSVAASASALSGRLLWYGRITPNKGVREAVAAAGLSRAKLDIVGNIEDQGYFDEYVAPALNDDIRYLGHQSGAVLAATVAGARAVVITPLWDEPFGLVAAEALACDRPIIAFDRGALAEVVGDCGVLVQSGDVGALANAMTRPPMFALGMCRNRAARYFSIDVMIDRYEACYKSAVASAAAASSSCTRTEALLA